MLKKKLTDELNKVANPENSQLGNQTLPAKEQQANEGLLVMTDYPERRRHNERIN